MPDRSLTTAHWCEGRTFVVLSVDGITSSLLDWMCGEKKGRRVYSQASHKMTDNSEGKIGPISESISHQPASCCQFFK